MAMRFINSSFIPADAMESLADLYHPLNWLRETSRSSRSFKVKSGADVYLSS